MAKLFLFAIGGTGSRVVKSLTMLLAAGVKMENTSTIIPIIIDPDSSNGDLTRTVKILQEYKNIRDTGGSDKSDFFRTHIASLDELGESGMSSAETFTYDIDGVKGQQFSEFIGFPSMDDNNKAFSSLLFSKSNLDANMEVGFKGNPNIGSVVLNKFKESKFFEKFASNFEENDRVFIVSSIFGGTGAAGFPLVLKNIRDAKDPTPHANYLTSARIGAVTVLPYFGVDKTSGSSIDSNTFVSKTMAALKYYADNICENNSINALYYIGDLVANDQKGSDGAADQRNNAHFIELASALAIVDFMSLRNEELVVENKQAVTPRYYEFGLGKETDSIKFSDLSKQTNEILAKPLTRYSLFKTYMTKHYDESVANSRMPHIHRGNHRLDTQSLDIRFRNSIKDFNLFCEEWFAEMRTSNVAFAALDTNRSGKDLYNQVVDKHVSRGLFDKVISAEGIENMQDRLNSNEPDFDTLVSHQKLLALLSKVTNDIVNKEIKL
jgi:hypothetical protein